MKNTQNIKDLRLEATTSWGNMLQPHQIMYQDPFGQAIRVMFSDKPFTKEDFFDINAQNANGIAPLHLAVMLNDPILFFQLINYGANVQIHDSLGRTPLDLATEYHHKDIVNAIFNIKLSQHEDVLKFSDFTLYKAKSAGITIGGFYHDKDEGSWLVKEGHYSDAVSIINEYVAGGLYQLFLGENAPQTEMIIDVTNRKLLTGSKLLGNFKTLYDHYDISYQSYSEQWKPYGDGFPFSVNGKKITGFFDGISAINFLGDTDAHAGNTGLIDHGEHYSFAKIDHGFSFNFYDGFPISLDSFRDHFKSFYYIDNLESLGFNEIYQSISKVGNMDFSKIESVVTEKLSDAKTYADILGLKNITTYYDSATTTLEDNINGYQENLLSRLKSQHQQYQKISDFMSLEKAIIDHDTVKLTDHILKGTSFEESFKPFFNPIMETNLGWGIETKSVTGMELLIKNWPNVLDSMDDTRTQSQQPLTVNDVLTQSKDLLQFGHDAASNPTSNTSPTDTPLMIMPQIDLMHAPVHVDFA